MRPIGETRRIVISGFLAICRASPTGLVDGQGRRGVSVHLGGPPNFGQDAPRRIRGQAIAQNHQGPLNLRELRALALLLERVALGSSI